MNTHQTTTIPPTTLDLSKLVALRAEHAQLADDIRAGRIPSEETMDRVLERNEDIVAELVTAVRALWTNLGDDPLGRISEAEEGLIAAFDLVSGLYHLSVMFDELRPEDPDEELSIARTGWRLLHAVGQEGSTERLLAQLPELAGDYGVEAVEAYRNGTTPVWAQS